MLDTADVTRQFLQVAIRIIGRKTSEEYAAVIIRNMIHQLQPTYPFLQYVKIRDTRFLEFESSVSTQEELNTINPKEVGSALKDLINKIMKSMGKTAGYFFIREVREKIGVDYDISLAKTMNVDLTFLQSTFIIEKKSVNLLHIETSDVIRRLLKTMIEFIEKQTSRAYAIELLARRVHALQEQYAFLEYIMVKDVRYTLGEDEIVVAQEINALDSKTVGKALQALLQETDKSLLDLGRTSIIDDLKTRLTADYLGKLEELGVAFAAHGVGYEAIFKQVIKTLIDVLSKTSTENYAIFAVKTFLQKTNSTYEFLKYIQINPTTNKGDVYSITIMNNFDSISETDARRAIQKLLGTIVDSLGEKLGNQFIQEFKISLDKKYLVRIEEMGVNLHMIELHSNLLSLTGLKTS